MTSLCKSIFNFWLPFLNLSELFEQRCYGKLDFQSCRQHTSVLSSFFFFELGCSAFGNLVPNNILAWALILSRCAVLTIGKPGNLQYFSAYRLFRMIALNLSRGVYISSVGCACYFLCTLPNNVCQKKKKKRSPSFYLYMYL